MQILRNKHTIDSKKEKKSLQKKTKKKHTKSFKKFKINSAR